MRFTKLLILVPLVMVACDNILDLGGNDEPAPAPAPAPSATTEPSPTPASTATYCSARTTFTNKCSSSVGKCELERSAKCNDTFSVYRPEYLDALVKCDFPTACPTPPSTSISSDAIDNCVSDEQDKTAPSAIQNDLADDLCATCPNLHAPGNCLDNFWKHGRRLPNGGVTVGGSGTSFDSYSDAMVTKLRAACVPIAKQVAASSSCWQAFYDCVRNQVAKEQPASLKEACFIPTAVPVPADQ